MQIQRCWVGPISAGSLTSVLPSTTPTANQLLLSTPVVLDNPRKLYLTVTSGEPSTRYIIVSGTGWGNAQINEIIYAPVSGTQVVSQFDFKVVTQIRAGPVGFSGAITLGTGPMASSRWIRFDDYIPIRAFGQLNVFGTVNYTLQTTLDDPTQILPNGAPPNHYPIWFNAMDPNVVGATASKQTLFEAPTFIRVTLNSSGGALTDYVEGVFTQHSAVPQAT